MDLQLEGRRALVTGAHRGTGSVIARRLAEEGASVLVHGFEADAASAVADTIADAHPVVGDLLSDAGVESLWQACAAHGPVDILVNNYGVSARGSFTETSGNEWQALYNHNVLSAMRLAGHALPPMLERDWGRIINLGTVGTFRPGARNPHYYSAKGALNTATESLAAAAAGSGVAVNLVAPGLIRTPEMLAWVEREAREQGWQGDAAALERQFIESRFPGMSSRMAERTEIADLVCFLASPRSGYIHGQILRIAGG